MHAYISGSNNNYYFCKSLQKDGDCWKTLCSKFPKLSEAKLKEGMFFGPDIRKLLSDPFFPDSMSPTDVVHNFLGNRKLPNYKELVKRMLTVYEAQGCNMSLKVYFLHSHLDYFPENLGVYSEEQGEGFHRDILKITYQGRLHVNMMVDYC